MDTIPASVMLQRAILAQVGIECGISGPDASGHFTLVNFPSTATQAQITQANSIASTWPNTDYTNQSLVNIYTAIQALTATQKTNISNDLFSGSPMKVLTDAGPNAASLAVLWYQTQTATLSTADKNLAKLLAAAMYVGDNPNYLVQPSFDTSINVPGLVAVS
jgi:hypothetical protein